MSPNDKQLYEELCGKELSDQEVFEAEGNLVGFFDLLYRIDKRIKEKSDEKNQRGANNSN